MLLLPNFKNMHLKKNQNKKPNKKINRRGFDFDC